MRWDKWRIPLMLAPAVAVIILLFGGGLLYGLLQSLGWQPIIGNTQLSLRAYVNILTGQLYAQEFWTGLLLTLWVSLASTALSAVLAVGAALLLRRTTWGKRLSVFLFQFNLTIPHIVAAVGILFLLSQSGLLARLAAQVGLLETPAGFPLLVRDRFGVGIILAYVWKETPFIGVILLAVLQSLGQNYEESARTLGANVWQRFRYVTLPLIAPSLLSTTIIVFSFVFGAYEVPGILGVRYPRMLSTMAVALSLSPDLNDRGQAMALSLTIAVIVIALVFIYMRVNRDPRVNRGKER